MDIHSSVLYLMHKSTWELTVPFLHNLILFSGNISPDQLCLLPFWNRCGDPQKADAP